MLPIGVADTCSKMKVQSHLLNLSFVAAIKNLGDPTAHNISEGLMLFILDLFLISLLRDQSLRDERPAKP